MASTRIISSQQVAGLSQLAGEFMLVKPLVIDLGWGKLKSALVNLQTSGFARPSEAAANRQTLVERYVAAFRHVEDSAYSEAKTALHDLVGNISSWVATEQQDAIKTLVDGQLSKLA